MKYWGGRTPPSWVREIAHDRPRPLTVQDDKSAVVPRAGDIVLKPFIDGETYAQLFRVETWNTHDLLDGPFHSVRDAMECAFEFGATSRLVVWLDYSDDPTSHDLDSVPLYYSDASASSQSVA
jgi:hypothetical protein